jgi:hypothetical protein
MSRMAHMELAIQQNLGVNLGDVIMYVNNGTKASQGDVQKMTVKQIKDANTLNTFNDSKAKLITDGVMINCYMLDKDILDNDPTLTGDYNVPRAISTFNKRIEPLMVVFKDEVRNGLIVDKPEDRGIFTTSQCELINGNPLGDGDQDSLEEVMSLSEGELKYWDKRGLHSDYMYNLAEDGWEDKLRAFETIGR